MKGVSQTSLRYSEGRVVSNTKHKSLEKFPILHTKAQLDNGQIGRARSRQQGEYSIAENDATTRCPQRSGTSGGSSFGITCGVFSFAFFSGGAADCGGLASRTRQVPLEDPMMTGGIGTLLSCCEGPCPPCYLVWPRLPFAQS